jgi:cytochrome c oxidase cbb3-type subunit IV
MYKTFFANMEFTALPIFALVLFIGMFVLMLARTWLYRKPSDYSTIAAAPLADDQTLSVSPEVTK